MLVAVFLDVYSNIFLRDRDRELALIVIFRSDLRFTDDYYELITDLGNEIIL